jgi:tRNA threonylcarbamoyladenosine biosynthesis protein TsaE
MTAPAPSIKPSAPGRCGRPSSLPGGSPMPIALADEAAMHALAARIAGLARRGDAILLEGGLGSGKTSFARGFLRALGVAEEVPSPTFTLVQAYDTRSGPVWHVDLYRLERPQDAAELGLDEARAEAILLVEWPERLGPLRPADALTIELRMLGAAARSATLAGGGDWQARLAAEGLA